MSFLLYNVYIALVPVRTTLNTALQGTGSEQKRDGFDFHRSTMRRHFDLDPDSPFRMEVSYIYSSSLPKACLRDSDQPAVRIGRETIARMIEPREEHRHGGRCGARFTIGTTT